MLVASLDPLAQALDRGSGAAAYRRVDAADVGQRRLRRRLQLGAPRQRVELPLDRVDRLGEAVLVAEQARQQHRGPDPELGLDLDGKRLAQVGDRGVGVGRHRLHHAELEHDVRAELPRRRLVERAPQVGRRGAGTTARGRHVGGSEQLLTSPRIVGRRAAQELGGHLVERRSLLRQQARGAAVLDRPGGGPEALVHRGTKQRMQELDRLRGREQARGDQGVSGLRRIVRIHARERSGLPQRRVLAQDRRGSREPGGRAGQAPQPVRDLAGHPLGALVGDAPAVQGPRPDRAGQLLQEERVAARGPEAGQAGRVVGQRRERPDDLRGGLLPERAQAHAAAGLGRLAAEDLDGRDLLFDPRGDDQRDRHALQPVGQVGERVQRRFVGPVRVVDEHRDRTLAREVGRQPVERVAGRERVLGRGDGGALERDAEQRGGEPGRAGEQRVGLAAPALQGLVEELAHDPEREVLLELGAARSEDREPGLGRGVPRRLHQRRLADAGRPVDQHHAAGALRGPGDRLPHHGELGVALEQLRGAHATLEAVRSRSIGPIASASCPREVMPSLR